MGGSDGVVFVDVIVMGLILCDNWVDDGRCGWLRI